MYIYIFKGEHWNLEISWRVIFQKSYPLSSAPCTACSNSAAQELFHVKFRNLLYFKMHVLFSPSYKSIFLGSNSISLTVSITDPKQGCFLFLCNSRHKKNKPGCQSSHKLCCAESGQSRQSGFRHTHKGSKIRIRNLPDLCCSAMSVNSFISIPHITFSYAGGLG